MPRLYTDMFSAAGRSVLSDELLCELRVAKIENLEVSVTLQWQHRLDSRWNVKIMSPAHWLSDAARGQALAPGCVGGRSTLLRLSVLLLAVTLPLHMTAVEGAPNSVSERQCLVEPDCSSEELHVWCYHKAEGSSPNSGCVCRNGLPISCLPCDSDIHLSEHCSSWCQGSKPCPPSTVENVSITHPSIGVGEQAAYVIAFSIIVIFICCSVAGCILWRRLHHRATDDWFRNSFLGGQLCRLMRSKENAYIDNPSSTQEQGPPSRSMAELLILTFEEPAVAGDTDTTADDQPLA